MFSRLPGTLYKLYDFVYYQLQQANLKKETSPSITLKRQSRNYKRDSIDAWADHAYTD